MRATHENGTCRFAISVALHQFDVSTMRIDYKGTVLGAPAWSDQLLIDVHLPHDEDPEVSLKYGWVGEDQASEPERVAVLNPIPADGGWRTAIEFPLGRARQILGDKAGFRIEAYPWTVGLTVSVRSETS